MDKESRSSTIAALVVAAVAFLVFGYSLVRAVITPEAEKEAEVSRNVEPVESSAETYPSRIEIPSIGIDAGIQRVGITTKGTMAVPTSYTEAGWYRHGPVPGSTGNAVLAGHRDNGFGMSAIFKRLDELRVGEDVYVTNASGQKFRFRVVRTGLYDFDAETGDIFSETSDARLNLITCEGTWNPDKKMYSDRRVVFTKLIERL